MSQQPFSSDNGFSTTGDISGGNFVGTQANVNIVASGSTWSFNQDSNTYLPGGVGSTVGTYPFTSTIINITPGTTVYVDLTDSVFPGPINGQVIIDGVNGTSEINGIWWYQVTGGTQFALYTDNTFTTQVDGSAWGAYVDGGIATGVTYGLLTVNAGATSWVFNADSTLSGNVANISLGAVSIGAGAGWNGNPAQGNNAISIGWNAGAGENIGQGENAIAIGSADVGYDQGANSIAIGHQAGWADVSPMGENAIAIGTNAAHDSAVANSIIINATGNTLNSANPGFYVAPVRNDTGNTTNGVFWNSSTSELTYATSYGNSNVSAYLAGGTDTANIVTTGNISGNFILGDGSQLTNLPVQPGTYTDSNVTTLLASGNVTSNVITTGIVSGGQLITPLVAFVNIATPSIATIGARAFISDSAVPATGNFGIVLTGGSGNSNIVPVWSDGVNWYIG